jgi:quinoprotein glucose dehydrogenase
VGGSRTRGWSICGGLLAAAWLAAAGGAAGDSARPAAGWPAYGGDAGGRRYSPLEEITPANVARLEVAWTYRTGDVSDGRGDVPSTSAFQATPILADGTLFLCTPFNRVIALDPETGAERWRYDPEIDLSGRYGNQLVCRGVSTWLDPRAGPERRCRRRIFTATNDARLIAIDAATGLPCADFGESGQLNLNLGVGPQRWRGEYQVTSPPAIVGDVVVVGSAVSDNQRTDAPSGVVRAYDARSGAQRWSWDHAPPDAAASLPRAAGSGHALGTPNVWAPMSVDAERGLLFVPTGNPAPDYYRGQHPEMDHYGSSVVALDGASGRIVWHFQTVHHDLWDFDVPAQPTLVSLLRNGAALPAVIQATKVGHLFVLHRETGVPLFPVEERPVPQRGVPGEQLSPTQPFPVKPPSLVPQQLAPEEAWGLTALDQRWCRDRIAALRFDGVFTPPSVQGTLMIPGNGGGSNWGGIAVDPKRQLAIANTMNVPWVVTLVPRDELERRRREGGIDTGSQRKRGVEFAPQDGTPYAMLRQLLLSPLGLPCNPPPWGTLAAVDLERGEIRWQVPFGTVRDLSPLPLPLPWGVPNVGGPLVTASGLVLIGAALDDYLRAFDVETGAELWRARLPAGGQATPMTYRVRDGGRQYVVIAAGGHARAGTRLGDYLIAYALPDRAE